MESKSLTLDELTNLFEDIDPNELAHDDSPDNTGIPNLAPFPAGKYGVRPTAIDVDRDQAGAVRDRLKFKVDFVVTDPPTVAEWSRDKSLRFIQVSGRSQIDFQTKKPFIELFRLCKGFEATFDAHNSLDVAVRFLLEKAAENATAYIQLDWKGFDSDYFKTQGGESMQDGSTEKKALYKACTFRGHSKFDPDGTVLNTVSGNIVKAKPYLRWTYPAKDSN